MKMGVHSQQYHPNNEMLGKRKRKRGGGRIIDSRTCNADGFGFSRNALLLSSIIAFLLLPEAAVAWTPHQQLISSERAYGTNVRLHATRKEESEKQLKLLEEQIGDDLDSLRAHAAKLRQEAENQEKALEQAREAKIQKQIDKVDGWIDDLLIEVKLGDGTELLKTVDQVYETLAAKRYSAHHVLKIFERLCDVREQESRSNCSPLMELLVDATGKLDMVEREDNPNKRWNHKVERVLRRKLFARDWNIEYVSDDEKHWF